MPRVNTQKDHPADDLQNYNIVEWHDIKLLVKKRFALFGFMRKLEKSPIEAIAMILHEESLSALEEVEMTMQELDEVIEVISKGLGAGNAGN